MYSLKFYDETLIQFDMDNKITFEVSNVHVISKNTAIFPELYIQDIIYQKID